MVLLVVLLVVLFLVVLVEVVAVSSRGGSLLWVLSARRSLKY